MKGFPKIISISGLDGTGKTSVANYIQALLIKEGYTAVIVHIGSGAVQALNTDNRRISQIEAYLIVLKDLVQVVLGILRFRNADVIILDRTIYDSLVKASYKNKKKAVIRLLAAFINMLPRPTFSFLLSARPGKTYQRDNDHSAKYHELKYTLYMQLVPMFNNLLVLDTEGDQNDIEPKLKKILVSFFSSKQR